MRRKIVRLRTSHLLERDTDTEEVNSVRNQRLANRLVWIA